MPFPHRSRSDAGSPGDASGGAGAPPSGPPTGPSWVHAPQTARHDIPTLPDQPPVRPTAAEAPVWPPAPPAPPSAPPAPPSAPTPPLPPTTWPTTAGWAPVSPPPPPPPYVAPGAASGNGGPGRPRRRSAGAVGLAFIVVVALVLGSFLGGAGIRELFGGSSNDRAATGGAATNDPLSVFPPTRQTTPGSGSGSSSNAAPLSSWSAVTAAVDPGVVDIESRLPEGVGAGTGMVLTDSGEILTNNHVIDGASQIVVTVTSTGKAYRAKVVGADPSSDVAVLQLAGASGLTTIPLGDSDSVKTGDQVAAIGNAGGQGGEPSVATGTVVGLHESITASDQNGTNAETLDDMIRVDANVVPGDSGGPLADTSGKVIGMDTAASGGAGAGGRTRFRMGGNEGFAIPINRALTIAKQLESGGGSSSSSGSGSSSATPQKGSAYLGVQVQLGTDPGAEIVGVESGSPADTSGLVAGDLITGVDSTDVQSPDDLVSALANHTAGDQVTLTWVDGNGQSHTAEVTLASR